MLCGKELVNDKIYYIATAILIHSTSVLSKTTMLTGLRKYFSVAPKNIPTNEIRYYLINNVAALFSALMHFVWIFLFWYTEIYFLSFFNIFSVALSIIMILMNRRGYYLAPTLLASIEVPLHSILAVWALGGNLGFEYYCVLIFFYPFIMPKGRLWLKILPALLSFGVFLFCIFHLNTLDPPYKWGETLAFWVKLINYTFVSITIASFAAMYNFSMFHQEEKLEARTKQLEIAKNNAEQSEKVKEAFLANMSHEIRTPLNAIIGFSDLMKQSNLDKQQIEHINIISTASKNLLVIINDILDLSKIDNEKLLLEEKAFSIREVIGNVIKLNNQTAQSKDLKLITTIDSTLPQAILGDPTRLAQVLVNLIGNAIKFTNKGQITVEVLLEKTVDENVTISFSVKDTGVGIPRNKFKTIFKRFSQAESSTTREYGGTGLGLSIAKKIVEIHDGKIGVTSELDKGTTFKFKITYPIVSESDISTQSDLDVRKDISLSGVRVLLVEDNEHNQILAKNYLNNYNALIDLAENGEVAIEKVKQHEYDCILMDLQMPKVDGYEATNFIKNKLKKHVPIIACTAHSLAEEKAKCMALGMSEYLSKPYSEQQLVNVILKVMGRDTITKQLETVPVQTDNETMDTIDITSALKKLHKKEGDEFIQFMLDVYNKRTPKDIEEIHEGLKTNNPTLIKQKAHLVAGTLSSLNFTLGFNLAKQLEKKAEDGITEEVKQYGKELIDFLNNSLLITESFIKQ